MLQQEAPKAAADWKQHEAPDGRVYFHSKALGESRWKTRDAAGALAGAPPASRPLPGPPPIQARALPRAGPAGALGFGLVRGVPVRRGPPCWAPSAAPPAVQRS